MDQRDRTIVFVDNSIQPTGASKALVSVINILKKNFRIVVITPNPELFSVLSPNVDIVRIAFTELSRNIEVLYYPTRLIRNAFRILKIIRTYDSSVIHYNDCYNLTGVIVKLLRPSIYLIYHVRLLSTSYLRRIYPVIVRMIFWFADKVICNSTATCRDLPSGKKKVLIPDGTEVPDHPGAYSAEKDHYVILYVGNYIPGKGQDFALECFYELFKLRKNVSMRFVGGTMGLHQNELFKNKLIQQAVEMDISPAVEFCDFVTNIEEAYESADILVNFSESESFSLVCLEAMAHGLPVICRDSGGPADFVVDGITGMMLNRTCTAKDAAVVIHELLSSPATRLELRQQAYDLVKEKYDMNEVTRNLQDVYAGV